MAVYTFSALTNGQSIAFNPSADVLNFDQTAISAAGLGVTVEGTSARVTVLSGTDAGKSVLLQNTSPLQLATSNVTFANGSALLFGDNSPGTANDNLANTLNGTAGNDLLQGFGGADTLNGGLGNDTYIVGAGDVINDTGGTDTIFTDVSFNVVANIENLTMTGTANINADGNTLANVITGNAGNNVVWANNADDTVVGGAGNDDLHGEAGRDWMEGGLGNDTVGGGADQDHIAFREFGAANADTVITFASNWDDIQLDAAAFTAIGASGRFAAGDVRFFAGAGANAGQDADDRIVYNTSTGQLWYDADGSGSGAAQLIAILGAGTPLVATDINVFGTATPPPPPPSTIDGTAGNDSLVGTPGNDTINGLGGDDTIDGLAGDDSIDGGAGNDNISGSGGNDTLVGGDGNDTLAGHAFGDISDSRNVLDGGLGNDTYIVTIGSAAGNFDTIRPDAGGHDTVIADRAFAWTLTAGLEDLSFTTDGGVTGTGNELNNDIGAQFGSLFGMAGNDHLHVGDSDAGSDLHGGDGNDTLDGGFRGDLLSGGAGNDVLNGGGGWAGTGDTFLFDVAPGAANADTINGFSEADNDRIQLDATVMPALGTPGQIFAGDGRFAAGPGQQSGAVLDYDTNTGRLWYDADGSGPGGGQLIATLSGAPTLSESDIVIVASGQTFNGTSGNDTITGGPGNDTINGFGGDDSLDGAYGADSIDGGAGNDYLHGGNEVDRFGDGADTLIGGDGNDTLDGWSNDGRTRPDTDAERLDGGLGNDVFMVDNGNDVLLDAGGVDTVQVRTGGWTLGAGFENLIIFDQEDGINDGIGNELDNVMESRAWEAHLDGRGGNDLLTVYANGGRTQILDGGEGNDTLVGVFGTTHATLNGGAGNDSISGAGTMNGGDGADTINGLSSDDWIAGGAGGDSLSGGASSDVFDFYVAGEDTGNDTIDGGADNDLMLYTRAKSAVVVDFAAGTIQGGDAGGAGSVHFSSIERFWSGDFADRITGDGVANDFVGGLGADTIFGGAGDDSIKGGNFDNLDNAGNMLFGGDGSDLVSGGGGNDYVEGNAGDDYLTGGVGDDVLVGGAGRDTLVGMEGRDVFSFDVAPDGFNADAVNDFTSGEDKIQIDGNAMPAIGASGNFSAGDARFYAAAGATSGHDADDRIIYDTFSGNLYYDPDGSGAAGAQRIANLLLSASGSPAALSATDITVVNGAGTGQVINGTAGNDTLVGGAGSDTINGFDGNDSLVGNGGNDSLNGGNGIDTMNGGLGDDSYVVTAGDVLVEGGGTDTVMSDGSWNLGADFENLTFLGTGNWSAQGNNLANVMIGNSGVNYFNSRAGDDTINAGAGNDSIDISTGGTSTYGNKLIDGGTGFDTIDIDGYARSGIMVDLAQGTMFGGGDLGAGRATLSNIERVVGGGFNDSIRGDAAANQLEGRSGNDTLAGAGGADTLVGGAGNDSFAFGESGAANADRLTDFASGTDRLLFDHNAFTTLGATGNFAAGDARFYAASGATSGHDADDRLVYNTSTGQLYYDDDGSGAHAAQLVATLNAGAALVASDITVI